MNNNTLHVIKNTITQLKKAVNNYTSDSRDIYDQLKAIRYVMLKLNTSNSRIRINRYSIELLKAEGE